jgi:hypothetical protein
MRRVGGGGARSRICKPASSQRMGNDWKIVKMKKKGKTRNLANPREPAPPERAASDVVQNKESPSALRVQVSEKEGVPQIDAPFLLMEALGTTDPDFLDGILCQLVNIGRRGGKADDARA